MATGAGQEKKEARDSRVALSGERAAFHRPSDLALFPPKVGMPSRCYPRGNTQDLAFRAINGPCQRRATESNLESLDTRPRHFAGHGAADLRRVELRALSNRKELHAKL